ncbi:MAG: hypothetical protein RIQ62_1656 [Bacteroidota bacterium]
MKFQSLILVCMLCTWQSIAQLANWSAVKPEYFPTNGSGQIHGLSRVSQLKFHPTNANKMYAISARGGLFLTVNGGTSWTVATGTDNMPATRLASVCIDHTNDQIIYLGTGDHNYYYTGLGVWKSTDGGNTFSQTSLANRLVVDMIMDPIDNQKIVAITDAGIYKTANAGNTWTLKTAVRPFDDIKQKAVNSRVLYAASKDSAFFRSLDFGETWAQITNGIVLPAGITNGNGCRLAVTPADTNVVYLGMVANGGTLYKSTDGGNSFTVIKNTASPYLTYYTNSATSSTQGDYNFSIGADRTNAAIVYLFAHCVWKSSNSGASWSQLTNWYATVHTDMHQAIVNPYNTNQLWNANDGGLWLSTDGGVNWTPKSDGIYGYEIYHGNCSPTRKDMLSIGTQDNGELYATSSGWVCNRGGDWGSVCAFDYRSNSSMVYYLESNKRRLVNGSESTYGLPTRVVDIDDIAFHRSNADLAFVADSFIYRTINLSASNPTWTQIASLGKPIKALHCAFGNANILYAIANDGTFYACTNALSATPVFTPYTLPNASNLSASITSLKNNPSIVYITCNTQVYRSANGGSTWSNINYNLPTVNHVRILSDEYYSANEMVLIASHNAVYYKTIAGTTWSLFADNLPSRTSAVDFSIFNDSTANTSLRLFIYGRGVWETSINGLRSLSSNFSVNNANPCPGSTVQFNDLSTGNVNSWNWQFPGGNPSSSTLQNPIVTYSGSGLYAVSLTVGDGTSYHTKNSAAFISTTALLYPPLAEGFEGSFFPPTGWQNIDNGAQGVAWAKTTAASGYGLSTSSIIFDNYSWNYPGQKDEFQLNRLNLSGATSAKVKFDVAYQVFSGYADSLAVLISTDCGSNWNLVYQKGGSVLSSAGSGGNNFVPAANQWRTDSIDISAFAGYPNVLIAFQNINGYGNKLYLDNINISVSCSNPTQPTVSASQSSVCAGQPAHLQVTSGSLNSAANWYWYANQCGGILLGSGTTLDFIPSSSQTIYVRGEGNCASSGACGNFSVVVNPLPIVSAASVTGCAGIPIPLTATPSGGSFSIANPYTGPTTAFTYSYTDANGCSATTTGNITTQPNPVVTGIALPNDSLCSGETLSLQGSGAQTYLWSNGAVNPINGQAFVPLSSSTYTLTGTDANGCTGTTSLSISLSNNMPTANNASRCGSGPISLSATASGIINWYSSATGGSVINTGNTYSPSLSASTTYYVDNTYLLASDAVTVSVGPANNAIGGGLQSTLAQYVTFDVFQPSVLQSVIVYPGAAGNVILEQRNASGTTVLNTTTLAVNSSQIGNPVLMTLNWPLTPGTGYRLYRNTASVSLYRNSAGAVYPYTSSALSITGNSLQPNYYYWAYNWTVSTQVNHYCTSSRVPVQATIFNNPLVTASNVSGCSGSAIPLSGTPAGGLYSVPNPYTGVSTSYTYTYTDNNGCSVVSSPASISVSNCNNSLNLTYYLQGYYAGGGLMLPVLYNQGISNNVSICDTVRIELRQPNSPYFLVQSYTGLLLTNGSITINTGSLVGSYYVVVKHRNGLPTWSANPVNLSNGTSYYDFSVSNGQAYGQNEVMVDPNTWALYSGDIIQDENIDLLDLGLLETEVSQFASGYNASDLSGDGNTDLLDFTILEPNISSFIFTSRP